MSANSFKSTVASDSDRPVQDEWGVFDPQRAGMPAVMRSLREDPAPAAASTGPVASEADSTRHCRFCTETLPPGAHQCPLCLREVGGRVAETREAAANARLLPGTTPLSGTAEVSSKLPIGAVYTLESPARCPECDKEIGSISVLRVVRTQVSFTSTLPRKAYVIVCPECRRLLSAGLSGLL